MRQEKMKKHTLLTLPCSFTCVTSSCPPLQMSPITISNSSIYECRLDEMHYVSNQGSSIPKGSSFSGLASVCTRRAGHSLLRLHARTTGLNRIWLPKQTWTAWALRCSTTSWHQWRISQFISQDSKSIVTATQKWLWWSVLHNTARWFTWLGHGAGSHATVSLFPAWPTWKNGKTLCVHISGRVMDSAAPTEKPVTADPFSRWRHTGCCWVITFPITFVSTSVCITVSANAVSFGFVQQKHESELSNWNCLSS